MSITINILTVLPKKGSNVQTVILNSNTNSCVYPNTECNLIIIHVLQVLYIYCMCNMY